MERLICKQDLYAAIFRLTFGRPDEAGCADSELEDGEEVIAGKENCDDRSNVHGEYAVSEQTHRLEERAGRGREKEDQRI